MEGVMTGWDDVLGLADQSVPATDHDQVFAVPSAIESAAVIDYVQDWFGGDDGRSALRLVVDGSDCGVLHRSDAYALVPTSDRGGLGAGDHGSLPGYSVAYELLSLRCPQPGCHVRAVAVSYDVDDPPRCSLHDVPMQIDD
jgi:hypothetical protein